VIGRCELQTQALIVNQLTSTMNVNNDQLMTARVELVVRADQRDPHDAEQIVPRASVSIAGRTESTGPASVIVHTRTAAAARQ